MAQAAAGHQDEQQDFTIKLNSYSFWFISIVIISLIARLYDLGERPLHQDESMLATFSWKLYEGRGYHYDPSNRLMHGPVLFYLNAVVFFIFGVSDYTTRLGQALFGTGLVALIYLFRGFISKPGLVAGAAFLGLGPTFLYYTRFGKHDPFLIFFCVLFIVFSLRYRLQKSNTDLYGAAASLAIFFCTKAHAWLYFGIFLSFFVVFFLYYVQSSRGSESKIRVGWQKLRDQIRVNKWLFVLGLTIFWVIFIVQYSSFFLNWGGVLEGLYLPIKFSIGYHHQPVGWEGPFSYYLPLFLIYELPVIVFVFYGLFNQLARGGLSRSVFLGSLGLTCFVAFYVNDDLAWIVPFIQVDKAGHLAIALYALFIGLWATFSYFKEGRTFRAFMVFWARIQESGAGRRSKTHKPFHSGFQNPRVRLNSDL